ncbi:hypothetical protein B4U80_08902 [Leptotrombidium deliense]|uniref:Uncharacterized protein n=1 Tax=Leptotrombidium deliense TaxID=299467 RepID=A0A443S125_9ACAR|nr:hypothetical protein B4U80_08902 [Leptotrombidium deliense]
MTLSFIRISKTLLKNIKQGKIKPQNDFEEYTDENAYKSVTSSPILHLLDSSAHHKYNRAFLSSSNIR